MKTDELTAVEIARRIKALKELQQKEDNPFREKNIVILKTALKIRCGKQLI